MNSAYRFVVLSMNCLLFSGLLGFNQSLAEPLPRMVFARKMEVGDRLAVTAGLSQRMSSRHQNWGPGTVPTWLASPETAVMISGTLSISEVDESGQFQSGTLMLERFLPDVEGHLGVDPFRPHQQKLWEQRNRSFVLTRGKSGVEIVEDNLSLTASQKLLFARLLSDATDCNTADRYSGGQPKRVGDEWPVQTTEYFARDVFYMIKDVQDIEDDAKFPLMLSEGSAVQLVEVSDCSGVECFEILATVEGTPVEWKASEEAAPQGDDATELVVSPVESVTVKESFRFLLPVEPDSLFKRCRRVRELEMLIRSGDETISCIRMEQHFVEIVETFVTEIDESTVVDDAKEEED